MNKIKLSLEDLAVRSFEVLPENPGRPGTVLGRELTEGLECESSYTYPPKHSCQPSCYVSVCDRECTADMTCHPTACTGTCVLGCGQGPTLDFC